MFWKLDFPGKPRAILILSFENFILSYYSDYRSVNKISRKIIAL